MIKKGVDGVRNKAVNTADHVLNGATKVAAKTVDIAKTVANRTKQIVGSTIKFIKAVFFPPGLWITATAVGIIICLLSLITIVQTFGPSDMDCSKVDQQSKDIESNGGASSSSGASWEQQGTDSYNNAKKTWDYWVAKGFSGAAVAGIIGNVATESGNTFNPQIVQGGSTSPDPASTSAGYGIYQFTPGSKYKNWKGYTSSTIENESDAVWDMEVKAWSANAFAQLTDVAAATKYWMRTYERPADQSDAAAQPRIDHANTAYQLFNGSSVQFDSSKFGGSGSSSSDSGSDGDSAQANTTKCDEKDATDNNVQGGTTDVKACDVGYCDFSWMCNAIKLCASGQAGSGIYPHLEYGYQCVFYAWNRLSMIHGSSGWNWVMGDGGDIWANLSGNSAWEVDTTPHPGDGISGHGHPFAGSTHVAVVEKVAADPSGWKIYISEGNANGTASWNSYHTRWLTKTQALTSDNHFFRNKSWKPISGS
jgi:hypothetical protein